MEEELRLSKLPTDQGRKFGSNKSSKSKVNMFSKCQ